MSTEVTARTVPPYNHFTQIGDPVLRVRAEEVPPERLDSQEINDIVDQMVKVLRHYDCVGVAAPQLGVPLRIIVMEFREGKRRQFTAEDYEQRKMSPLPLSVSCSFFITIYQVNLLTFVIVILYLTQIRSLSIQ